jgi:hypothetical protein
MSVQMSKGARPAGFTEFSGDEEAYGNRYRQGHSQREDESGV